jgi:diadenosine tetraphosphate (Ap4A) HIT family hydrolase
MTQDPTCVFCKIIAGEADASIVFRDDTITVFMDNHPITPGHMLVVPNQHAEGLLDVGQEQAGRMFVVGRRMAEGLRRSGLRCEGVNLFLADGAAAGQTVFHSHLHVIPRFQGDGLRFHHPGGSGVEGGRTDLEQTAERIREGLERDQADDGA